MIDRSRKFFPIIAVLSGLLLCLILSAPLLADDDDDGDGHGAGLVGTWRLTVTGPGGGEFFFFMVFHRENTLTGRGSASPAASMTSGVWKKMPGHGNFVATMEQFSESGMPDGSFDIRFRVFLTIQLLDNHTMIGTSSFEVLSLDGTTVLAGPIGGFTHEGTRMTVLPE